MMLGEMMLRELARAGAPGGARAGASEIRGRG